MHDNFFELGGSSLLAVRAVERITNAVGPGIELIDLFRAPTIAGLADKLVRPVLPGDESANSDVLVVLRDGPGTPVVFVGWIPDSHLMSAVNPVYPIWFLPLPGLHRPNSIIASDFSDCRGVCSRNRGGNPTFRADHSGRTFVPRPFGVRPDGPAPDRWQNCPNSPHRAFTTIGCCWEASAALVRPPSLRAAGPQLGW